ANVDPVRVGIRLAFVVMALVVIGWDLPSSFSWENDGVAPRDIFAGVAENLRPGHAFRYPLLHPLLLGLLCLPVLLPAALRAASWEFVDLRAALLTPAVMTPCALIGRMVAVMAAVIALAALGRITERLAGRRAARWAEAFAATNISFAYYGHATNLDGPALMWSVLAVEALLAACTRARRGDLIRCALFAAASVATKDQAYATYVLLVPGVLLLRRWRPSVFAAEAWTARAGARAAAMGAVAYLVTSGAAFNPAGLITRVRTLLGPASGAYRLYETGGRGVLANLADVLGQQGQTFWPWPVVALAWAGVAGTLIKVARGGSANETRKVITKAITPAVWRLLPLGAGFSALAAFVLAVGRNEHRFVLPLGFWLAFYAGVAAATAFDRARSTLATAFVRGAGVALLASAMVPVIALAATQRGDGRRAVEAWLQRLPASATVETYGPLVYLPRFDAAGATPYRLVRVGPDPLAGRNPLLGMNEIQGAIAAVARRRPDVVIITEGFATPYLADADSDSDQPRSGRILPAVWRQARADSAVTTFVRDAVAGRLPDYQIRVAGPSLPPWLPGEPRQIHASTGLRTWLLVRRDSAAAVAAGDIY
ncbi:MAG TPA: hypothetical protein VGL59_00875, partial [Polyangia bacterium]